ncbi:MAG TPA: hypothetical protein ENK23_06585 [Sorangium sp.]|nr:hypothetical protein [Sorangium sp.]
MSAHHPGDDGEDLVEPAHQPHFDAVPTRVLGPGEAPSPSWLPLLGLALMLGLGVLWSMTSNDSDDAAATAPSAAPLSDRAATPKRAAAAPKRAAARQPIRLPNQPPVAAARNKAAPNKNVPSAADLQRIQRMLQRRREAGGLRPPADKPTQPQAAPAVAPHKPTAAASAVVPSAKKVP